MGSGKSSVGPLLANALNATFIDLDCEIEKNSGLSINTIFAEKGEAWFRRYETEQLFAITSTPKTVIATGGGIVIDPENINFMRKQGIIVNLQVSLEEVLVRTNNTSHRPLLAGKDTSTKAKALLNQREVYYADADIRIDTALKTVEDVVAEILHKLKGLY